LWDLIPGQTVELDSRSEIMFDKLRAWTQACDKCHQCVSHEPELPTRILDLKDAREKLIVRVFESRGARGRYIALSHCWGAAQFCQTTSDNLQSHIEGIILSTLPKTFQDAVEISNQLNVRYLWIDSLCIVQGDRGDWERESSKMFEVYSQSWLTVAASASTEAASGCFPSRNSSSYVPPDCLSTGFNEARNLNVMAPFCTTNCSPTTLYYSKEWMPTSFKNDPRLYNIGSFGGYFDPVGDNPLSNRAWTLQERYLSPRVVHYAKDQVYFQCLMGIISEDGARFPNLSSKQALVGYRDFQTTSSQREDVKSAIKGFVPHDLNDPGNLRLIYGWNSLVELYSKRELTKEMDKLPALSGIARWIAQETNDH